MGELAETLNGETGLPSLNSTEVSDIEIRSLCHFPQTEPSQFSNHSQTPPIHYSPPK